MRSGDSLFNKILDPPKKLFVDHTQSTQYQDKSFKPPTFEMVAPGQWPSRVSGLPELSCQLPMHGNSLSRNSPKIEPQIFAPTLTDFLQASKREKKNSPCPLVLPRTGNSTCMFKAAGVCIRMGIEDDKDGLLGSSPFLVTLNKTGTGQSIYVGPHRCYLSW